MTIKKTKLSIIIVNYFSEDLVINCINSIIDSDTQDFEIIIVDNGSNKNILNDLKRENIRIIKNKRNEGFAYACNLGVKNSDSEYLLFLNPDTEVYKNSIADGISVLSKNREITVLGCKQIDEYGNIQRSCSRYVNLPRYINKMFKLYKLKLPFFKGYHMSDWDHKSSRFVDHVIGAFYLINRKDFLNVNGFSEDYFVYYEDLDLSKKITDSGGKIYYDASIEIYHKGGGASEKVKAERLFYSLDSLLLFSKKHLNYIEYLMIFLIVMFFEPFLRLLIKVLKLDKTGFLEIVKSYRMLYKKRLF